MFNEEQAIEFLEEYGAITKGHFELSSGKHSDTYLQCSTIFQYPDATNALTLKLAESFFDTEINVVLAPAVGGVVFGFALAQILCCRAIFAERKEGKMCLRREFTIHKGEKVLIADDVVTTGSSIKEMIDVVESRGGEVVGIVCVVDRGEEKVFNKHIISFAKVNVESYEKDDCPLCKQSVPIYSPGSRKLKS